MEKRKGTKNKPDAAVTLACSILLHLAQLHKYNAQITFCIIQSADHIFADEKSERVFTLLSNYVAKSHLIRMVQELP